VYAALAMALVVTYRSSGVVNFATGAMALFTAYVYAYLRQGELLLLVPGLPKTVDVGGPMGFWPATVLATAISAVLGHPVPARLPSAPHRPGSGAPWRRSASWSLPRHVAATGTSPYPSSRSFHGRLDHRLGPCRATVSADRRPHRFAAAASGSRFGLGNCRAETEKGAYERHRPDRLAAANWMISAAVAGCRASHRRIVPLVPISTRCSSFRARPPSSVASSIPAPAAGGHDRHAAVGGHVPKSQHTWLPESGLPELVPLVLILLVLVVRPGRCPQQFLIQQTRAGRRAAAHRRPRCRRHARRHRRVEREEGARSPA
jgi:hypothetical protein